MKRKEFAVAVAAALGASALPDRVYAADVDYDLTTSSGALSGTLTLPAGTAKVPVVVIIAGSGATDRNGNSGVQLRTNAYAMIAAALASRGIATVRYDKRGIGKSAAAGPPESDLRFDTYAGDAAGWIAKLRADARFEAIGIAGHSEGSLVGMLAAQSAPVDAYISLEGPGRPAGDVLRTQLSDRLKRAPKLLAAADAVLTELIAGKLATDVPADLDFLFRPSVQPYLISWFKYDPAVEIKKVRGRLAIVQGTADLQVPLSDGKLLAAAVPDADFVVVPGMSHVLKDTPASNDLETQIGTVYADPSIPIDPAVPATIAKTIQP